MDSKTELNINPIKKDEEFITYIKSITTKDYIREILKTTHLKKEDIEAVAELTAIVSNEVANAIIFYTINNTGRLPKKYIVKVAESLKEKNIDTAEKAYDHFIETWNRQYRNRKKNKSKDIQIEQFENELFKLKNKISEMEDILKELKKLV